MLAHKLRGSALELFLETAAEIGHFHESHLIRYFGYVVLPCLEQFGCMFESDGANEETGGLSGEGLDFTVKRASTHMHMGRKRFDRIVTVRHICLNGLYGTFEEFLVNGIRGDLGK